jgi:fructokinase
MQNKKFKVAGLGEALWDMYAGSKSFGGAPANFACHSSMLGAEAFMISCIGDDVLGRDVQTFLYEHRVSTEGIAVNETHETGIVNVTMDAEGRPEYEIRENVAWDHIPFTLEMKEIANTIDAVCFGTLSQRNKTSMLTIQKFLDATSGNCLRMLDINIRQDYYNDEVIISSLNHANALKLNEDELPVVATLLDIHGNEKQQLNEIMNKFELKLAILTFGSKGALMLTEDMSSFVTPPRPEVLVSTVGAGDSYTATAIIGYLKGLELGKINMNANKAASFVCSQMGAVPRLPTKLRQEVV